MKHLKLLFLIVWAAYTTQAQPEAISFKTSLKKNKTVLPISYRNGANPMVEVMVNGKGPYKFMFDTGGAGEARLDIRLFNELKLKSSDSVRTGDGSGRNDRWLPIVNLESITLGDYVISSPRALVRNYNKPGTDKIDGVIGLGFFENALVELNFAQNQLIITKGTLDKKASSSIPFSFERGVPVINGELNGKKLDITFDTGNMGGLTFHSSDISPDIIDGEPKVIGRAQTVSNTFEIKEAHLKVPLKIGSLLFENPTININDVVPQANMGVKFSKRMNITFDVTNKLMKLEKFETATQTNSSSVVKNNEFTGSYEGGRTIVIGENGYLYIKRLEGTPLKMIEKKKDEYGLEIVANAILSFERDEKGKVITLKTSRDNGISWENHKKTN